MIGLQVHCNQCGMKGAITNKRKILRLENDRMAIWLQSMWKEVQEDAQFEKSQIVNCNKCGMKCRTTHNFKIKNDFKIRKWLDSKSIAMNVERDVGQLTNYLKLKKC